MDNYASPFTMFQINKFSRKFMSTAIAKDVCFIQTTVSCRTSYHAAGNKIVTILHMKKYDVANIAKGSLNESTHLTDCG